MAAWTSKIIFLPSVTSTNDYLKEKARCGAEEGTVVWAAEQTVGRGRQNRHWESRPGLGLYCSILLRPQEPFSRLPFYTLFPALAVVEAMEACCNLAVQIKWPNDLVIKKVKWWYFDRSEFTGQQFALCDHRSGSQCLSSGK
jgi:BirA family biotin operon repressor/biotin-[acetyl-CoA-carboxylase] ligase